MIGVVGLALGQAGISITSMAVGPSPSASTAMMVLSTGTTTPPATLDALRSNDGIIDIHAITLK